ncbi:hypothetical protein HanIR_Chr15g0732851 [Helianthus annuus]|nr:hypothetical protein HanIR_Chr15g0732851 [Helianthus annuus]
MSQLSSEPRIEPTLAQARLVYKPIRASSFKTELTSNFFRARAPSHGLFEQH